MAKRVAKSIKAHINSGIMGGKGGHHDSANKMPSGPTNPNLRDQTDNRFGSNSTTTNDELDDQWSIVL